MRLLIIIKTKYIILSSIILFTLNFCGKPPPTKFEILEGYCNKKITLLAEMPKNFVLKDQIEGVGTYIMEDTINKRSIEIGSSEFWENRYEVFDKTTFDNVSDKYFSDSVYYSRKMDVANQKWTVQIKDVFHKSGIIVQYVTRINNCLVVVSFFKYIAPENNCDKIWNDELLFTKAIMENAKLIIEEY